MIAKIGHGENITGALAYNQLKVQKDSGAILFMHKMVESPDGNYSVAQLSRSFEPYLLANLKTEKPVLHISLNPDPGDSVSDESFGAIAHQYMRQMGYGNQPFVVFKHTDTSRTHIHIVSVCVDEEGKKISDAFERRRSMDICRSLEQQFNLLPATAQDRNREDKMFQPVDYKAGDIKSQIASVVRYLPRHYQFPSMGAFNALLSLCNISVEEVNGELHGVPRAGLVYFALNEQGEKVCNPFKASLFGKAAGYALLQAHFKQSKERLKNDPAKASLRDKIESSLSSGSTEAGFKQRLSEVGVSTVVRRNAEGRVYGITFIDHVSRTVWNGSQLGKDLSANVFNDWWNNGIKPSPPVKQTVSDAGHSPPLKDETSMPADPFDFLEERGGQYCSDEYGVFEALGGLLPEAQGEDYDEQAFLNRMKKKKKKSNKDH
jgi:hypothetical protein